MVVNCNRRLLLEQCLHSLERETVKDFELIPVESGSTDGSVDALARFSLPPVTVIRNPGNHGFGPAVNQGIPATRGQFIALINNDIVARPVLAGGNPA